MICKITAHFKEIHPLFRAVRQDTLPVNLFNFMLDTAERVVYDWPTLIEEVVMKRLIWLVKAYIYMHSQVGWARWDYVSSLYETFVVEDSESNWTPEDAVSEDLSYWGD